MQIARALALVGIWVSWLLWFSVHAFAQQAGPRATAAVRVLVTDVKTMKPLAGVTVRLQPGGASAETAADGRVVLRDVAPGTYALQASLVANAYVEQLVTVVAGQTLDVIVSLAEGASTYAETVSVTGLRGAAREPGVAGQQIIGTAELKQLGGVLMDDPMRALQALPGVAGSNDRSAIFSVRGSAPRRTQMVLDGIPATSVLLHAVENPEWGSAATLNSDVLADATLLSGAYPQRSAGGIGPQVQFRSRDGALDRVHVQGIVSGTAASGIVDGPIGGARRGSWIASFRQSYIGLLANAVADEPEPGSGDDGPPDFWFSDALAKFNFAITPSHRVTGAGVGAYFTFNDDEEIDLTELGAGKNRAGMGYVGLQSTLNSRFVLQQRGYLLGSRLTTHNPEETPLIERRLSTAGYRADITAALAGAWTIDAGGVVEATRQRLVDREVLLVPGGGAGVDVREQYETTTYTQAAYGQARWQGTANLTLTGGARVEHNDVAAATTVSPWGQAEWRVNPVTTVRAGAGLAHEFPLVDQLAGVRAGVDLEPERAFSADFSVERRIGSSTRVTLTAFAREERDVIWLPDGEPRLVNGLLVPASTTSRFENLLDGHSRGFEAMVMRSGAGRLTGWLSYSFADTDYENALTGEQFAADYDQRHTVNAYLGFRLSRKQSLGVKYSYGSNFPVRGYYVPGPIVEDSDGEETLTYLPSDQRNLTRLPLYSRLDLRWNRIFSFQRSRLTLFVEVMNVLGRANFAPEDNPNEAGELLPRLPSAGIIWEF